MAHKLTATELRNMQTDELRKEISEKRAIVAKMHIEVQMRSEKDTARFLREKKALARMLTVLNEKKETPAAAPKALKAKRKTTKLPVSK